ncbi:MAG TPA: M48 family metalloprotease [Flavobacteriales bacterium]|nr:M48 family metalloprotease [Flavobacteriales bacterium]
MEYKTFFKNKIIPEKYREAILTALSHYPELKDARIEFRLTTDLKEAYATAPTFASIFQKPENRLYRINILEQASPPMEGALLKNCTLQCQVAVIAHELAHVKQFHERSRLELFSLLVSYMGKKSKKLIERNADILAIEHGFGSNLYAHANYIRSIPGYIQQHPELDENYLKPHEILIRLLHKAGKFDGEIAI